METVSGTKKKPKAPKKAKSKPQASKTTARKKKAVAVVLASGTADHCIRVPISKEEMDLVKDMAEKESEKVRGRVTVAELVRRRLGLRERKQGRRLPADEGTSQAAA